MGETISEGATPVGATPDGVAALVGCTGDEGMPPVEATLDFAGSLAIGAAELVGCGSEDGTPAVEPTLDLIGSLVSMADEVGEMITGGKTPVGALSEDAGGVTGV